jgi:hypothetical protein
VILGIMTERQSQQYGTTYYPSLPDNTMTSKVKSAVRRVGPECFPRWVIVGTKSPDECRLWNGKGWVQGLRNAMLFAHKDAVLKELKTIRSSG